MIGRRTLIELLHIAAGVIGAAVIVFMGVRPLRMAWRADRNRHDPALRN